MPRLMSVAHTIDAVVARRKTETRRLGWLHLPAGADLDLCEKVMGRRKGEPLVRLARVHVTDVHRVRLNTITDAQAVAEGVEGVTTAEGFIDFYCATFGKSNGLEPWSLVTRIVWTYLPTPTDWCICPPCPGRGTDGHGMTHCAECCFGTGVEVDLGCPVHGLH